MQLVDSTYFNSVFPELSTTPPALITALAPIAQLWVSQDVFPVEAQLYAQALVLAHWVALQSRLGAGPVTEDRVGDVASSYAALPVDKGTFKMTTYGQRYLELGRLFKFPTSFVPGGALTGIPPFGGFQPTWDRQRGF